MSYKAFTLIELLIVVAIIAILAAIAVPNFLEAQTRSKISRVKNDLRSMSTAMESYYIDQNAYPDETGTRTTAPGTLDYSRLALPKLSTPVAYLTNGVLQDPFADKSPDVKKANFFGYVNLTVAQQLGGLPLTPEQIGKLVPPHRWSLASVGPDGKFFVYGTNADRPDAAYLKAALLFVINETTDKPGFLYDATNGTSSGGDVVRTGSNQL